MVYAIKSVNGQEVNKCIEDWDECKKIVLGKKSLYKSCKTKEEAFEFLRKSPAFSVPGGVPQNVDATKLYVKYVSDRFTGSEGYTVKQYVTKKGEKVICRGTDLPSNKNLQYILHGSYSLTKKYGYQFEVERFEEYVEDTRDAIVSYLCSGVIKGIGKKKALDIYEKFGKNTIEILEKTPEKLLKVKGISKKTLDKITTSYNENRNARRITTYLLQFGISAKYALKLYKQFGVAAESKIRENPYLICNVKGLTFDDADNIADACKIPKDSTERFRACAVHVLKINERNGSTGMEINAFGMAVWKKLNTELVKPEDVNNRTVEMIKLGDLKCLRIDGIQCIFTREMYERERHIAENILRFCKLNIKQGNRSDAVKANDCRIDQCIKKAEERLCISLDEIQKTAVFFAIKQHISLITGGPGTGKTTVIKVIDMVYHMMYPENERIYMAPSGRAARKIAEVTDQPASTIHSRLKIYKENTTLEDEVMLEDSLIVVDEFSMVDIYVANMLFEAITNGCRIVIVGDIDQLPSVKAGAVMRDITESGVVPTIRLSHIYRQNEKDKIYENAKKIKSGDVNIEEGDDFHMYESSSLEDIRNMMAEKYKEYVNRYGIQQVMCLCPYIKEAAGVDDMNMLLQDIINPESPDKKQIKAMGKLFREGDLVMQVLENTEDASNGDIGIINEIVLDEDEYEAKVKINGKTVSYTSENIVNLSLAYAMSVHKSQGGEAKAVITCLTFMHSAMLYMNIPYVAISRGKIDVSFFGEKEALVAAIKNGCGRRRITSLGYWLKRAVGEFLQISA